MRTIVRGIDGIRRLVFGCAAVSSGLEGHAEWGDCRVSSRLEACSNVTNIWVSGLMRIRISPGSHSHRVTASRQDLTCILLLCIRVKLNVRIRRIHEVTSLASNQLEIDRTLGFDALNCTIHGFSTNLEFVANTFSKF